MPFESGPGNARRFRRSLLLGTISVVLSCSALELFGIESIAYFGGEGVASRYERMEARQRGAGVEVIALGPSHVENGFDAELFTERTRSQAFNFGIAGTDLLFQARFARHVLIPLLRPKTIFWGVLDRLNTANPINAQYLESAALARAEGRWGARSVELEHALPQWKKRRFAAWFERLVASREADEEPFGQTRVSDVWDLVPGPDRRDRALEGGDATADEARPSSDPEATKQAFDEALRFARAQGVQVYVFMAPYDPENFERGSAYSEKRRAGKFREYDQWLTRTLAKHRVPLVNLRYCAGITDATDCFYQPRHLNQRGARAMTEILARIFSGEPIPEEWRGTPSPAERVALGLVR